MSGDPEQEYFADGMVEDIITALSRFKSLFVIARNSSFTYKGRAVDVKQVARELGVRYVLEGSVRRGGSRVRVTAQLIDATSGAHVWAERYDRDLSDIFAVQDEITASVAGVIEPALAEAEQQRVLRKPPERLDAWEAYQRGVWHFNKDSAVDNQSAQGFFRRAINSILNSLQVTMDTRWPYNGTRGSTPGVNLWTCGAFLWKKPILPFHSTTKMRWHMLSWPILG